MLQLLEQYFKHCHLKFELVNTHYYGILYYPQKISKFVVSEQHSITDVVNYLENAVYDIINHIFAGDDYQFKFDFDVTNLPNGYSNRDFRVEGYATDDVLAYKLWSDYGSKCQMIINHTIFIPTLEEDELLDDNIKFSIINYFDKELPKEIPPIEQFISFCFSNYCDVSFSRDHDSTCINIMTDRLYRVFIGASNGTIRMSIISGGSVTLLDNKTLPYSIQSIEAIKTAIKSTVK